MPFDYRKEIRRYGFPGRFASELVTLFERNNKMPARKRRTDNMVSFKTAYRRFVNTCAAFHDLHSLGYKLQSIYNFQERHVRILVAYWEKQGHSVGTIDNKLSYLRAIAKWLGKIDMIKESRTYASDPASFNRKRVTVEDKTWTGNGIDPLTVIDKVRERDPIVAMQLELQLAFGLRVEESMLLRPVQAFVEALEHMVVRIEHGTKGGRPRKLGLDDVVQLNVLERARGLARGPNETMIQADYKLKQWRRHYYYVMRVVGICRDKNKGLGITSHGLRHEYVNRLFERITGKPSPVKGGEDYDPQLLEWAVRECVERAGHEDIYKIGAYIGNPRLMAAIRKLAKLLAADIKALAPKDKPEAKPEAKKEDGSEAGTLTAHTA